MSRVKAIAVIPAYNEEETLGEIIHVLNEVNLISRVVVISDGSTDETARVARQSGAEVIELQENVGKGGALQKGIERADAEIYLFLDGDLLGLQPRHVEDLLRPVYQGEAEMTLGIFESGRRMTDLALQVAPYLSGQRAVHRTVLEAISGLDTSRFGVEMALTRHIKTHDIKVQEVPLRNLSHRMKEEKLGLIPGFIARLKMYWEILKKTPPAKEG